jgi:hypothetical protein
MRVQQVQELPPAGIGQSLEKCVGVAAVRHELLRRYCLAFPVVISFHRGDSPYWPYPLGFASRAVPGNV